MMNLIGKAILQFGFFVVLLAFAIYEIVVAFKDQDYWCIAYGLIALIPAISLLFYGLGTAGEIRFLHSI